MGEHRKDITKGNSNIKQKTKPIKNCFHQNLSQKSYRKGNTEKI